MYFEHLYKLPWSKTDNPNGWIEPTTFCNLKCPGCYRGCDQELHSPRHLPLSELKQQIDWLVANRNIHTLSIAGGEPLLYVALDDLIVYAKTLNLRIMVYTNGMLLTKDKLLHYSKLGVTQFLIHIDEFQQRDGIHSQTMAIEARKQFCQLFRTVKGTGLGFIQPLSPQSLINLNELTHFFSTNRDVINLVVFTLYREIHWEHSHKPQIDTSLSMNAALDKLQRLKFIKPASYLPATINKDEPAWVFSYSIGTNSKVLGFILSNAYKKIQLRYRNLKGRFMFISRNNKVSSWGLISLIKFEKILSLFIRSLFAAKPLYLQTCLIIRGPIETSQGWDLCEGCPDAMLYNGTLLPSCILEDLKKV